MDVWRYRVLLMQAAVLLGSIGTTGIVWAEDRVMDKIITPDIERRQIKEAMLDTEDFEIGAYYGIMNVEDFGSNNVTGLRLAYHVSEDYFLEAAYGRTKLQKTTYEDLSGAVQLLTPDQRDMDYYNLSVGYNLFPGEVFIGEDWAFNTNLYVILGVGNTNFADEEHFTYNYGAGFRFFATDAITVHLDVRDHLFEHDVLGQKRDSNNLETHLGVTLFF